MIGKKFYFIVAIILFNTLFSFCNVSDTNIAKPLKYDTNYIKSYYDWFHITLVGANKQSGIALSNVNAQNDLSFSTNNPFGFGLAFDYEWFTFEYTKTLKGLEFANDKKGSSNSSSLSFGLTGRKIRFSAYYQITQGYYLDDIKSFVPDWFDDHSKYPLFPELASFTLNLSLYYTFNHRKFSNTAALWQLDRQIKSAGSPIIGLVTNMSLIESLEPLILNDTILVGNNYLNIKSAANISFGLTGGYMHTFSIKKKFYIHGAIMPSFLYNQGYIETHDDEPSKNYTSFGLATSIRLTAGYNGEKIYGGIFSIADNFINDILADKYEGTTYSYFRIYVGYRFYIKKKPWMKKLYL